MLNWQIHLGDALSVLKTLPAESVECIVTSPPYWGLRNYGVDGQIGLETTPDEYADVLVRLFHEARRVLRDDGTLWLNLGDCYNAYNGGAGPSSSISRGTQTEARPQLPRGYGLMDKTRKAKDLLGIPWMVAFALRADGWYLRSEIIWHKKSCMPESVKDRPTKAHEQVFLLTKQPKYWYDADAIREKYAESTLEQIEAGYEGEAQKEYAAAGAQDPSATKTRIIKGERLRMSRRRAEGGYGITPSGNEGKPQDAQPYRQAIGANARSVWTLGPEPFLGQHFATMPKTLARRCILAGCPYGGTVLDPFVGSGTTCIVALEEGRNAIGIELNEKYHAIARQRLSQTVPLLAREVAS